METEKRLIDANVILKEKTVLWDTALGFCDCVLVEDIDKAPTVDAVEVVFCDECENYGKCYPETIFRLARIEKPFCCVGKRKTNTNCGAKMDGDGNG